MWHWPPTSSTAEVKERVELHTTLPLLPLWAFVACSRVNFTLPILLQNPQRWKFYQIDVHISTELEFHTVIICPLSPTLFSLVIDTVLKKLDLRGNISTRLRQLTAYADDILITAHTRQSLIDTFQQLKKNSMEVGLIINEKKTKYLKSTKKKKKPRNESLNINNLQIEQLQQCKYLGSIINVTESKKKSKRG